MVSAIVVRLRESLITDTLKEMGGGGVGGMLQLHQETWEF